MMSFWTSDICSAVMSRIMSPRSSIRLKLEPCNLIAPKNPSRDTCKRNVASWGRHTVMKPQ